MTAVKLTEAEKEQVCICAELAGRTDVLDSELMRVCNAHTAAVESLIAARNAAVLRDAAKQIAGLVPYGYGMNPDGTEDRLAAVYIEGHREAWQLVTTLADEFDGGTAGGEQDNGQANYCRHLSASGIDATSGPSKVWRCDHCGMRWTQGEWGTA